MGIAMNSDYKENDYQWIKELLDYPMTLEKRLGGFSDTSQIQLPEDPIDCVIFQDRAKRAIRKIAQNKGATVESIIEEITKRKSILEWMAKNDITDFIEVRKIINEYYKNPEKIMKQVGAVKPLEETESISKKEESEEKKEAKEDKETEGKEEKKAIKVGIPDIFGFKVVSEK